MSGISPLFYYCKINEKQRNQQGNAVFYDFSLNLLCQQGYSSQILLES
jgi:hypothetical protein